MVAPGTDESMETFVGDVTTYHLHNLKPGTTYDLKLYAEYEAGLSGVLPGQGTTRMYPSSSSFNIHFSPI